jgi:glutamate---cysteine ligase / carboxylate-amine ligase
MQDFSLGIEEEYLLVDAATRDLVAQPDPAFMRDCARAAGELVAHELLQAQVEIGTPPCADIAEARRELLHLRRVVVEAAEANGMRVIAASTHPFSDWRALKRVSKDRYDELARDLRIVADRLAICGMHVHVGVADPDVRIDLMNQASYFLPHLLTLSTSSPFWLGRPSGLKAYRPTIFRDLPRSGLPEWLEGERQWQDLLATLEATGLCKDGSKIWWDLRPSVRFPTLEMRVCDICTRIEDAIAVTALFQALLATLYRLRRNNQSWRRYRHLLIDENKWRAQCDGVEAELADFGCRRLKPFADLAEELIELVGEEAARLGCAREVARIRTIVTDGTSADHQLRVYRERRAAGADEREALEAVVDWLIEETRADLVPG